MSGAGHALGRKRQRQAERQERQLVVVHQRVYARPRNVELEDGAGAWSFFAVLAGSVPGMKPFLSRVP